MIKINLGGFSPSADERVMPTQLNWSTSPAAASNRWNHKPSLQPCLPTEAAGARGIRDLFKSPNSSVLACSKQHLYVISCKSSLVAAWNPLKYFVCSNSFKVINHRCFSPVFSGWEYPNLPTGPVWAPPVCKLPAAGSAAHRCLDNSSLFILNYGRGSQGGMKPSWFCQDDQRRSWGTCVSPAKVVPSPCCDSIFEKETHERL